MVNSGSSANLLAISALTSNKLNDRAIKPGDEVLTVAAGFPTTVAPILQNNLVPVYVDIDLGTYVANTKALINAISPKTGFRPAEMVLGAEAAGNSFLDLSKMAPPHYSVKSNKLHMEQLSREFKTLTEIASKNITELINPPKYRKNSVSLFFCLSIL
jgi:hypothetical protein